MFKWVGIDGTYSLFRPADGIPDHIVSSLLVCRDLLGLRVVILGQPDLQVLVKSPAPCLPKRRISLRSSGNGRVAPYSSSAAIFCLTSMGQL